MTAYEAYERLFAEDGYIPDYALDIQLHRSDLLNELLEIDLNLFD